MTPGSEISQENTNENALSQQAAKISDGPASSTFVEDEKSANTSSSVKASLAVLAAKLPLQLDLRVPVPSFRVQNLLSLEKGQIVETIWPHTEDLPLWSGGVQLVWSEFEVVDQKLAVRVTRLA
ncbi:MAG TPA: FliM/FliN family flagellar motor C-terminal domain-containing protein [Pseudacidobacterium sp.]|jgi:flagellar motor switch protein FliN/FliY|nr:FliM/FliN family flagellar motor C-terminal domain-containing protein [Pseudacidobacterium sp.]